MSLKHSVFGNFIARALVGAVAAADSLKGVNVVVERAARNSRRLYAAVQIAAPAETVWGVLTDYEGLSNFIPGIWCKQHHFDSNSSQLQASTSQLVGVLSHAQCMLQITPGCQVCYGQTYHILYAGNLHLPKASGNAAL